MEISPVGSKLVLPNGKTVPLSKAYRVGDLVFTSGQLPFNADGTVSKGDIVEQTSLCLAAIESILAEVGSSKDRIVKATVWLTRTEDFAGFNSAYAEFFGTHLPARSTVRSDLMLPGALVEIEAVAAL